MAGQKNKSHTIISAEEVLKMEIIVNQALINILIAKQVISEKGLLKSIRKIWKGQVKMISDSEKIVLLQQRTGPHRVT